MESGLKTSFMSDFHRLKDARIFLRTITVVGQYDGFHKYEDAPDEVAFLRNNHRHLFKWKATIEVFHNDRDVEFFMAQTEINRHIIPFINFSENLGSCETQAEKIIEGLVNTYGTERYYSVEVSEDGENCADVSWTASP